jgi:NAD(P)-dependent dehydrogenase (short-subunit alcohol dehydrogenase family)
MYGRMRIFRPYLNLSSPQKLYYNQTTEYVTMALELNGKTALVTGGGSGICLELTKKLLAGGCNVVVADLALRPEAVEVLQNGGANAKAIFIKTDVTKWDQLQNAFDAALKSFQHLDIVVPGAGVFEPVSLLSWHSGVVG